MSYLVRKISIAKWPTQYTEKSDIPGDAISDIRTNQNTLSFWKISDMAEMERAVLALSASSKSSCLESIVVVWLPEDLIANKNIIVDSTLGDTIVPDLASTHCDLSKIKYEDLGEIATLIDDCVCNKRYKRYTKNEIKDIVKKAYIDKRIDLNTCSDKLLKEIQKL